jgi:hypothetical protein
VDRSTLAVLSVAPLLLAGCLADANDLTRPGAGQPDAAGPAAAPAPPGNNFASPDAGLTADDAGNGLPAVGLPCEVETLLVNRCSSCHGPTPSGGAPMPLVTWGDLTRADLANPSLSVAAACLARMQDPSRPMPPSPAPAPSSAELMAFASWVTGGAQQGTCGGTPDGGVGPTDSGPSMTVCTSGQYSAVPEGSTMDPGMACIACHQSQGVDAFQFGGTVYPTRHEPDTCIGASTGGLTVEITDSAGTVHSLTVNAAGNFRSSSRAGLVSTPYTARVVNSSGAMRAMATPQTSGDCNGCHTEQGQSGAPGRIMAP